MTRDQIVRVAILSGAILVVVVALDYLVNVVIAPGLTPYTPIGTVIITLLVAPAFTSYVVIQNAKVDRAERALESERVARLAADGANIAKTQFIANMSHELRTPLNAIIGYAEMVEEDASDGGLTRCAEDSRRILRSAYHLLGLISEILDHARLETGKFELRNTSTELAPVFADIAETGRVAAAVNGNAFKFECAPDIGVALLDPLRLRQCVLHLTNNAAKFTKNGLITLRVARASEGFVIEVSDTGVGMDEATAEQVFQPFAQADSSITREQGGLGLGLAVTKQILDAMGGQITVRSKPNVGSTFTITMKRANVGMSVATLAA